VTPVVDARGDYVCEHGTAVDVHCCGCHSGFLFEDDHVCAPRDLHDEDGDDDEPDDDEFGDEDDPDDDPDDA